MIDPTRRLIYIYHSVKVSPRIYFWPYFHLAIRQSLVYSSSLDRAWWQFCEVSPFSVHLVLDTFDIWHAVIELTIVRGSIGRIRTQRSSVD